MNDTPPHIEALQLKLHLQRSPEDRIKAACGMYDSAKALVTAGLKHKFPHLTPEELRAEVFRRFYADDFPPEKLERIIAAIASREK